MILKKSNKILSAKIERDVVVSLIIESKTRIIYSNSQWKSSIFSSKYNHAKYDDIVIITFSPSFILTKPAYIPW